MACRLLLLNPDFMIRGVTLLIVADNEHLKGFNTLFVNLKLSEDLDLLPRYEKH